MLLSFNRVGVACLLSLVSIVWLLSSSFTTATIGFVSSHTSDGEYLESLRKYGLAHCIQLPPKTNLMTLSDEQLSLYGLPSQDEIRQQPQFWSAKFTSIQHRACSGASQTLPLSNGKVENASPLPTSNVLYPSGKAPEGSNWAGNIAYGNRGTYRSAATLFRVSQLTGSPGDTVSFWAGVGGYETTPRVLVQAGITFWVDSNGRQQAEGFWEVPTLNYPQVLNVHIQSFYDTFLAYVSSNVDNDGEDYFLVEDTTDGSWDSYVTYDSKYFSDGASGECIGERPGVFGKQPILENFGTAYLSGCTLGDNSGFEQGIGNWPHDYAEPVVHEWWGNAWYGNNTLIAVGPISNTTDYSLRWQYGS